jgi:Skp family chaperone for outer membrane proteins
MKPRAVIFVSALLSAIAFFGARAGGSGSARFAPDPAPARFATCDVYHVIQRLFDSDLKPLADELQALGDKAQAAVQNAPATDPAAQAVVREFQEKRAALNKKQQEMGARLQKFKGTQLVECYELARASVGAVADRMGYTYVLASRRVTEKVPSDDPQIVVEALLQRPVLRGPDATDITDDVLADLKLK